MKKFLLILSVVFLLTTEVSTFACSDKNLHEEVQVILKMKDGLMYIKDKKLIVKGQTLLSLLLLLNDFDKTKIEEQIETLGFLLATYAVNHGLDLELSEEQ
ncbi:hypothetical protein [Fusobacterium ulcerans]|uniref:hypothetical protein n=1 Tax=Fusobacterium ulcerans TaxID=861 RepID=UPI00102F347F|nr:hypothetical protein [Fusobacterium ulcerans]